MHTEFLLKVSGLPAFASACGAGGRGEEKAAPPRTTPAAGLRGTLTPRVPARAARARA